MDSIGNIVRAKREAKKWTQRDLSKRAEVTQGRIAQLETGNNENISLSTLRALAGALGCAAVDLLPDEFKRPPKAA